ncbi:MAG: thioredoxin [Dorea sp.]|nr:thioredoxin [Dorea sp.]
MSRLRKSRWTGILFATAGLILMGFGIYRGEMSVVLEKAVNICMECIGIG